MSVVLFEKRDRVLVVTINRPEKRNAINEAVREGLRQAWRTLKADRELRVGVLTGAGDKAFSAGRDLYEFGENLESLAWLDNTGIDDLETDENLRKPVIAAIEGYCIGIGLTLAIACDMRIAAENAVFRYPEVTWGVPTIIGAIRLPRVIPQGLALEMLLTGEPVDAREAHRIGLVNRVVPNGTALAAALVMAEKVARNAPLAVQATREVALRGATLSLRDAWRLGEGLRGAVKSSAHAREGMAAFRENRREANFEGE